MLVMPLLGPTEIVLVGAALLALVIGPKKLPELARSLGESKKEFKKSMKEADEAVEEMDIESTDREQEVEKQE